VARKTKITFGIGLIASITAVVLLYSYIPLFQAEAQDAPSPQPQPAAEEPAEPTAESPEPAEQVDPYSDELEECRVQMRKYLPTKQEELMTYLEEEFEGEGPNSGKVNEAIDKYMLIRDEIWQQFLLYSGARAEDDLLTLTARAPNCYNLVEENYVGLEQALKKYVISTSSSKVTSQLVDKYKEINGELSGLNMDIGKMKGYIDAFESRFPCFIKKCTIR